jgi:predicted MFS family arabinose efflux permease
MSEKRLGHEPLLDAGVISSIFIFTVGAAVFLILPIFVGALVDLRSMTDTQAGLIASSELLGTAVMSIWSFFWIKKWNWRRTAMWMAVLLAALELVSIPATDVFVLSVIRFGNGMAAAVLIVIPTALIARRLRSERLFAIVVTAEVTFQILGVSLLPRLIAVTGIESMFIVLAVLALIAAALAKRFLPEYAEVDDETHVVHTPFSRQSIGALAGLAGTLIYFTNIGAVWAFIQRIGVAGGLNDTVIGDSLGASLMVGLGGAALAVWFSDRYGYFKPLSVSSVAQIAALGLLLLPITGMSFLVSVSVYTFFWNFILPYQMAAVARVDYAQQFVVWIIAAQAIGDSFGPGIAGLLVDEGSYSQPIYFAATCIAVSMLLFIPVCLSIKRHRLESDSNSSPAQPMPLNS